MNWIDINDKDKKPPKGIEMLLFNADWMDSDFNPHGIRIGFLCDAFGWTSAYWCNYHDRYYTRISDEDSFVNNSEFKDDKAANQIPTHYCMFGLQKNKQDECKRIKDR